MNRDIFKRAFGATDMSGRDETPEANATGPDGPGDPTVTDKILDSLKEGRPWFFDVSGNGTEYVCSGARFGAGFAEARLTIQEDGVGVVTARAVPVPEELEYSVSKLCRRWNQHFRLPGLTVRDGYLTFVSDPIDLVDGSFEAPEAVGMALSTLHTYSSAVLALRAGVDPWELINYNEWKGGGRGRGGDDDDEDDGLDLSDDVELSEIIARMSSRTPHVRETCA